MRARTMMAIICTLTLLCAATTTVSAAPMLNPNNGHYYEFISAPGITWDAARAAAQSMSFNGLKGDLATLTSFAEDDWVHQNIQNGQGEMWVGGFQLPFGGANEPDKNWQWINGEGIIPPPGGGPPYENWFLPLFEPNNFGGAENHLAIGLFNNFGWNDEGGSPGNIAGFVVEYAVPEPTSLLLCSTLGLGAAGGYYLRRRKRKTAAKIK